MEKTEIIKRAQEATTLSDFANLLSDIKREEFGNGKYRITEKQLRYFSSPKFQNQCYTSFYIPKKSGGVREINAPCGQLKKILYVLNIVLKTIYTPSNAAMGFVEGRSVVSNAMIHTGHYYVFNIDLENFFPSIPQARVWKRLQLPPFNFPIEIANVVAGLTCHKKADAPQSVLPQGAPTSPILTNAICDKLDRRLIGLSRRFGVHFSRYADDITFSSLHNVYQEGSDFRKELSRIIREQGFTINPKKTRLQRSNDRQEVTGLTVNTKVNVAKKYVRDLRCILHVWEKEGYNAAYAYFFRFYNRDKGYIKKGTPCMENVVEGKLNYLCMVKGVGDSTYQKLLDRFKKLKTIIYDDEIPESKDSYHYLISYGLKEFEDLFHTAINLYITESKNLIAKCEIEGKECPIFISKSVKAKLDCHNGSEFPDGFVTSDALKGYAVTLCRANEKNIWLITKSKTQYTKIFEISNTDVDIEDLLLCWDKEGLEAAVATFQNHRKGIIIDTADG